MLGEGLSNSLSGVKTNVRALKISEPIEEMKFYHRSSVRYEIINGSREKKLFSQFSTIFRGFLQGGRGKILRESYFKSSNLVSGFLTLLYIPIQKFVKIKKVKSNMKHPKQTKRPRSFSLSVKNNQIPKWPTKGERNRLGEWIYAQKTGKLMHFRIFITR